MVKGTTGARNFVIKSSLEIAVIVGVIYGGAYLAKKYNIGAKSVSSLVGVGQGIGAGITAPFQGLVSGFTTGTEGIVSELDSANKALFGQISASTDSFNKFIHPDWYNSDGSYSTKNPNYNPSLPGNGNPNFISNTLTPTSGTLDSNKQATNNTTSDIPVDTSRNTQRSNITNPSQPGSNLVPRNTIISTSSNITASTPLPSGFISTPKPVTLSTLIRGQPLNQTLTNLTQSGVKIQSSVISTRTGGTREVAGSPGLLARLAANLKSG